ncbi:TPA: hypothetical protein ACF24J_003443 [Escherichia coli]|uniref:hypothetical protein n=1 Tax=Escherichia coli TaxID=562 RepID=UPI0021D69621|nr:hypothetical protein [Escherichia coli]MCU7734249.1 hypothetical protein [Escherichia coli]
MAERNSIDLIQGSQDLSSSFYQYHRKHGGLWYIKNSAGQFLDCSDDFLSFSSLKDRQEFLLREQNSFMASLLGDVSNSIICCERKIVAGNPRIILFIVANINNELTPLVVTIHKVDVGIYVKIDNLSFMGIENLILENIGVKKKRKINSEVKIDRLYSVNPFSSMDEKDWSVAWLMSVGLSKSEMAKYLDVSDTVIKRRMQKIYRTLLLKNYNNFMYVSDLLLWRRFVPPSLLRKNTVSVLNLNL